jgi:ComEC/Rec2-related protein
VSALVPAALAAAVGILRAASGFPPTVVLLPVLVATGLSLSGSPVVTARARRAAGFVVVVSCGFALGLGSRVAADTASQTRIPVSDPDLASVCGTIRSVVGGDRPLLTVSLERAGSESVVGDASGEIRLIAGEPVDVAPGRYVRAAIMPRSGLAWRDDDGMLWARPARIDASAESAGSGALFDPVGLRAAAGRAVDEVSGSAAPMVAALLLGDGDAVDPRVDLLFRRSGSIHLLALSGMHLAVIALLVRACTGWVVGRAAAAWLAVAAGFAYLLVAGPRPGLVRASLLVFLSTAFGSIDRGRPLVEVLACCFLVHLIVQPGGSSSLGFQLSYLSLFGIALFAQPLAERLQTWIPAAIGPPIAAGVAAQLLTTPLLLARFGAWYPVGMVASVLMGPIVVLIMSVGLVAVILDLAGVGLVAVVSKPLLELLVRAVESGAWVFSAVPGVRPGTGAWGPVAVSAAVALLAVGFGLAARGRGVVRGRRMVA